MKLPRAKSLALVFVAGLGASSLALFATDCTCTLVGCDSGAFASVAIETDLTTLDGSKVEMCRNTECFEGVLRDGESLSVFCEFPESSQQCFGGWSESGKLEIDFSFFIDTVNDDFEDGDTYAFRVFDPDDDSVVLAEVEGEATYNESASDGPWCGEASCYGASIE